MKTGDFAVAAAILATKLADNLRSKPDDIKKMVDLWRDVGDVLGVEPSRCS
jgi:hypothetical protein